MALVDFYDELLMGRRFSRTLTKIKTIGDTLLVASGLAQAHHNRLRQQQEDVTVHKTVKNPLSDATNPHITPGRNATYSFVASWNSCASFSYVKPALMRFGECSVDVTTGDQAPLAGVGGWQTCDGALAAKLCLVPSHRPGALSDGLRWPGEKRVQGHASRGPQGDPPVALARSGTR